MTVDNLLDINTYQCRIKALQKQVEDFKSEKKYQQLIELRCADVKEYKSRIHALELELADSHKETIDVRKKWLETFDDIEKAHRREVNYLVSKNAQMEKRALSAERQRDKALDDLTVMRNRFATLSQEYEDLLDRNAKLLSQLNHDYENSSIPSSKSIKNKKISNSREKTDRKPGAQPGHKHHGRKKQEPTEIIKLDPPKEALEDPGFRKTTKEIVKQLVSLRLFIDVIEYHADIYYNSSTNEYIHAPFPDGVKDDVNYDGSIKAFLYLLNNDCNVSIDKARNFLRELSSGKLEISQGMINNLSKAFSDKSKSEIQEIFSKMLAAPVMNTDCTNAKVNGNSAFVFVCAVPEGNALYFARKKKGHEGVKDTVTEDYQGILVHDHESTFYKYGTNHQECLAHVLRYLKDSMENEKELTWNEKMRSLLQEIIHYRNKIPDGESTDPKQVAEYERRYSEILELAQKEYEDNPPGKYYRDGFNLYKRMDEYKSNHLLFLHDMRVPATNNLSERLLRAFKRKQAQATVFRSQDSIGYLCDGMSMLNLIRLRDNTNVFEEVTKVFQR